MGSVRLGCWLRQYVAHAVHETALATPATEYNRPSIGAGPEGATHDFESAAFIVIVRLAEVGVQIDLLVHHGRLLCSCLITRARAEAWLAQRSITAKLTQRIEHFSSSKGPGFSRQGGK